MNNHWTRMLQECCAHTKPIMLPCDTCRMEVLRRLHDVLVEEGRQFNVSVLHETADSVAKANHDTANAIAQRERLKSELAIGASTIETLRQENKRLKQEMSDMQGRLHADAIDTHMKKSA